MSRARNCGASWDCSAASSIRSSNYSFGSALVFLPHVARQCAGLHRAADFVVVDRAPRQADGDVRRRQSEEHAGDQRRHGRARDRSFACRTGDGRCAVINVSPIREDGPAAVAPEWIAIRPGTDTAMLLALTHTLITEGLHDQDFLARYCTGFERVQPYVMGEADGQPKDADWAETITGVPAQSIRALAREMAATAHDDQRVVVDPTRRSRRAAVLGGAAAGLLPRPDRTAGRRLWFRLWLGVRHCRTAAGVSRAGNGRRAEPAQSFDPGGANFAMPAASRRGL